MNYELQIMNYEFMEATNLLAHEHTSTLPSAHHRLGACL